MNEKEAIALWTRNLSVSGCVKTGVGDDCAVLDLGNPDQDILFKTDAIVESVHFLPDTPPAKVGRKAICRTLSDIAAMGGIPDACLVTLGMNRDRGDSYMEELYQGMRETADLYGVSIVGGETVMQSGPLSISIAMIGRVPQGQALLRSGAHSGDAIFISGELGGSLAGRHLDFEPRLEQGQWLRDRFKIHAMIDVSDGLATDLRHIMEQSHVGAEVLSKAIPISREARRSAREESGGKTPLLRALTDGEDYELLFTVAASSAVALLDAWNVRFPDLRLSCIGKVTSESGLRLMDETGIKPFALHGYDHLKQS